MGAAFLSHFKLRLAEAEEPRTGMDYHRGGLRASSHSLEEPFRLQIIARHNGLSRMLASQLPGLKHACCVEFLSPKGHMTVFPPATPISASNRTITQDHYHQINSREVSPLWVQQTLLEALSSAHHPSHPVSVHT